MSSISKRIMSFILSACILISSLFATTMGVFADVSANEDLNNVISKAKAVIESLIIKNDTKDEEIIDIVESNIGSDYSVKKIGDFVKDAAVHGAKVTLDGNEIASTNIADGSIYGNLMIKDSNGKEASFTFSKIIKAEFMDTYSYTSDELVKDSDISVLSGSVNGATTDGKKILIVDGQKIGATKIDDNAFSSGSGGNATTKLSDSIETVIFRNVSYMKNLLTSSKAKVVILDGGVTYTRDVSPDNNQISHNFANMKNLKYISLNEGLKYIGYADYSGVSSLFGVVVPDSVEQIAAWAFSGATGLYAIKMPASQSSTTNYFRGGGTFNECSSLISLRLPEGMKSIASQNFYNNVALESIVFPSTFTTISELASMVKIVLTVLSEMIVGPPKTAPVLIPTCCA